MPLSPGVKQACCDFLESQLDPSNCLGIRDFAETHNCLDLMQAAEVYSQKHFPEVVQHEEFMLLQQEEVEKLIRCDEIQVQHSKLVTLFDLFFKEAFHFHRGAYVHLASLLLIGRGVFLKTQLISYYIVLQSRSNQQCSACFRKRLFFKGILC